MPWPAMKATMSSLSERRLSGCIDMSIVADAARGAVEDAAGLSLTVRCWRVCILRSKTMIFSKDYVGYLARQTVKHLVADKMIETDKPAW